MDIDTLIFILVFLAIVISNIKKIFTESKNKGKAEKTKKTDLLQKLIGKVVSRIQEEITPEARVSDSRGSGSRGSDLRGLGPDRISGWDAIIDKERPIIPYEDPDQGEDDEDYITLELDEAEIEVSEDPELALEEKIETIEARLPQTEETLELRISAYTINELRKAIVWSEIIAPPVGLRVD